VPLRHLCNLLQIHGGDVETVVNGLPDVTEEQKEKVRVRAQCAWHWITTYAPEDFKFSLRDSNAAPVELDQSQKTALQLLYREVEQHFDEHDEASLSEALFSIAERSGLDAKQFFQTVYKALIDREKGPRLANFIMIVGKKKTLEVLTPYKK
jgi:lysyl-tRNA synthetase class 1